MVPKHTFNVGDIVRLKNGTAPITLSWVGYECFEGRHVNSGKLIEGRLERLVPYENYYNGMPKITQPEKETNMDTNSLYSYTDPVSNKTIYATYLATDSSGNWVVEGKSGEGIFSDNPDKFVEVVPYTVRLSINGGSRTVIVKEGTFSVGDILFGDGLFWTVTHLDTKKKDASPLGKGFRRVLTEPINDS